MRESDGGEASATGLRARILSGDVVVGMMVYEFFSPALPRIIGSAGVDFAVFDMESTGLGHRRLETLAALSRGAGVTPIVRVPSATADEVGRCLGLGAAGVMAPKITHASAARQFAAAVRYPPEGARGSGYAAHPNAYTAPVVADERAESNREVIAIGQLESLDAIENAEEIVAVDGIDAVNVGVNDLAAELGVSTSDPRIRRAVATVLELCAAHQKAYLGKLGPESTLLSPEHRMVLVDHDVAALAAHTRSAVEAVTSLTKKRTP